MSHSSRIFVCKSTGIARNSDKTMAFRAVIWAFWSFIAATSISIVFWFTDRFPLEDVMKKTICAWLLRLLRWLEVGQESRKASELVELSTGTHGRLVVIGRAWVPTSDIEC
jgi:hypothetical protein